MKRRRKIMSKKIKMTAAVLMLALAITGCSSPEAAPAEEAPAATTEAAVTEEAPAADLKGIGDGPIMITAFGQSADVAMMKALLTKAELAFEYNPVVTAAELGDTKTIVVAAGASTKGLGAAGIKPEDELKRAEEIMAFAKENDLTIVVAHLGGSARRGDLSDQFIDIALADAKAIVVVADGNQDGKFTDFSSSNSVPMASVESISNVVDPMKEIFSK